MRCAAPHLVVIYHDGCERDAFLLQCATHAADVGCILPFAPHDIELASAALLFGVHLVAVSCSSQGAPPVVEEGQVKLGGDGVAWSAIAQYLAGSRAARVGVAALDHEVLYHAVKQRAVIVFLLDQHEEVVAVQRGVVRKRHSDVARRGLDEHDGALLLALALQGGPCCAYQQECEEYKQSARNFLQSAGRGVRTCLAYCGAGVVGMLSHSSNLASRCKIKVFLPTTRIIRRETRSAS